MGIPRFSILALLLLTGGSMARLVQAQESITVPVNITVTSPVGVNVTVISPFETSPVIPSNPTNGSTAIAPALGVALPVIPPEVCGGIGDPLQAGFSRFEELTRQRAEATTIAEQDRLDREILEQGLRLPDLVTEDLGSRGLARGQSDECDALIDSIAALLQQVADYLGALQDARTALLW
jgi:hypothetical protein